MRPGEDSSRGCPSNGKVLSLLALLVLSLLALLVLSFSSVLVQRYSVYLPYWYKSTNADEEEGRCLPLWKAISVRGLKLLVLLVYEALSY